MGWFERRRESDLRKNRARLLYDFEVECRRQGWGDPAFVYDEAKDLFRWTDGRFAFSREHADWTLLRKRGRMKGL
jgi:hypothetical protein